MKNIVITIAVLIFFGSAMVKAQEVKVTNSVPGICKTADRCLVEITIEKGAVEGFARIQQTLPEGIRAELVNDGGSDFTFDKQRVSFIWLSLPSTSVIKVSYRLMLEPGVSGSFGIGEGSFSCLVDNKIQKYPILPVMVEVNPKPGAMATAPKVEPKSAVMQEPVAVAPEPVVPVVQPREEVPAGGVRKEEVPAGGIRKNETKEATTVAEPKPESRNGEYRASGGVVLIETVKNRADQPETKAEPVEKHAKQDSLIRLPLENKGAEMKVAEQEPPRAPVVKPLPKTEEVVKKPATSAGITWAVQFTALRTFKEPAELKRQFGIKEEVHYENADGWHRYTFGAWATQSEADIARKNFTDRTGRSAFVVRMQNGRRAQ